MPPPPPLPPTTPAPPSHGALAGAVRVVASLTLLSRFAGLIRDLITVRIFGDTRIGSSFNFAFAIPNLFRRLLGEGALSAAFLPEYTTLHRDDPATASRFASLTLLLLAAVTGSITLLLEAALFLSLWLAPPDPDRNLSITLTMVMLPYMPLVCIAAILGGMLQVHGRFAPLAAGPIILNVFIVAVAVWYIRGPTHDQQQAAFWIAIAAVLSGAVQVIWSLALLRRNVRWTRDFTGAAPSARRMLSRFVPVVIGMGTLQLSAALDILIANYPNLVGDTIAGYDYPLDDKSNAILSYTQRLYQFPLGVFGLAVATAVFPLLSRHATNTPHFLDTLRRGLRLSLFIGLPASAGLVLVRHHLTAVVFSGGSSGFSPDGVARAAAVLLGYAPAVWAYSLNHVYTRAFYAKGDTRTPMRIALLIVALNLAINLVLIWHLREAGLAWGTSFCAILQCLLLARLSRTLTGGEPHLDRETLRAFAGIALAAAAMTAAVLGFQALMPPLFPPSATGWREHAILLAGSAAVGFGAFVGAAVLLRLHELRWLVRRADPSPGTLPPPDDATVLP